MGFAYNTWGASWKTSWANSWGVSSSPTPAPTIRDQGAGAGRRKAKFTQSIDSVDKLQHYRDIGEQIAKSVEKPVIQQKIVAPTVTPPPKILFVPRQPKVGDVTELRNELSKLKFDISEEILLQAQEDEVIFMLMMTAV